MSSTEIRSALIFPGQGSQQPNMLDNVPNRDMLEHLLDAAEALSGFELREIAATENPELLTDTRFAQPLLYLTDWGWGRAMLDSQVRPQAVAGHSLGEFAALAIADVFSPEAGLELVIERSKLMAAAAEFAPGGMAAVLGLENELVRTALDGLDDVWLANDNSPGQVVISGTHEGIEAATRVLSEAGSRRIVPLKVAGPFHSPLMEPARKTFAAILSETELHDAAIPVIQNAQPTMTQDASMIRERLMAQITSPVRWVETMQALTRSGPIVCIECGPGSVLRGLARQMDDITAVSVETMQIEQIVEEVLR